LQGVTWDCYGGGSSREEALGAVTVQPPLVWNRAGLIQDRSAQEARTEAAGAASQTNDKRVHSVALRPNVPHTIRIKAPQPNLPVLTRVPVQGPSVDAPRVPGQRAGVRGDGSRQEGRAAHRGA
jgi:hypothetical protein